MKWKRKAVKAINGIQNWLKDGNVNVVHMYHLLKAHLAVLNGKDLIAQKQFKLAIAAATKNGFIHDLALSHEMASEYFGALNDDYWRKYHLEKARTSYFDWGATAKATSCGGMV